MTAFVIAVALLLDALLGEARRFHPLVGFGRLTRAVEQRLHRHSRLRGVIAVMILLIPFTAVAVMLDQLPWHIAIDAALLYLAIGWKSLGDHARDVGSALQANDLATARQRVGYIVSRDTSTLDEEGIAKATVESVLENGNDAIFGALFWFVIAGAPGVVLYRLANTLDAMWGYRNERYLHFGWAAARFDDLLNYIPARLTALSYAVLGRCGTALHCWRVQGTCWKSPNAGPVMAAGAGSLGLQLGGIATYHGITQMRPPLGEGRAPNGSDIERALQLIRRTLLLWVVLLFAGGLIVAAL